MSNAVNTSVRFSQDMIYEVQEHLLTSDTRIEEVTEHFFAPGVYGRMMKVPAGSYVIGKAHRQDHISILLKGKALITGPDGQVTVLEAPQVFVVPAGAKKMAYIEEEMWFMNIHPTDTEDLELIEAQVIIPEDEHRLMISKDKQMNINTTEAAVELIK